jgi:hypothetical protein
MIAGKTRSLHPLAARMSGLYVDEIIDVGREELMRECDYELEAKNQRRFQVRPITARVPPCHMIETAVQPTPSVHSAPAVEVSLSNSPIFHRSRWVVA